MTKKELIDDFISDLEKHSLTLRESNVDTKLVNLDDIIDLIRIRLDFMYQYGYLDCNKKWTNG